MYQLIPTLQRNSYFVWVCLHIYNNYVKKFVILYIYYKVTYSARFTIQFVYIETTWHCSDVFLQLTLFLWRCGIQVARNKKSDYFLGHPWGLMLTEAASHMRMIGVNDTVQKLPSSSGDGRLQDKITRMMITPDEKLYRVWTGVTVILQVVYDIAAWLARVVCFSEGREAKQPVLQCRWHCAQSREDSAEP